MLRRKSTCAARGPSPGWRLGTNIKGCAGRGRLPLARLICEGWDQVPARPFPRGALRLGVDLGGRVRLAYTGRRPSASDDPHSPGPCRLDRGSRSTVGDSPAGADRASFRRTHREPTGSVAIRIDRGLAWHGRSVLRGSYSTNRHRCRRQAISLSGGNVDRHHGHLVSSRAVFCWLAVAPALGAMGDCAADLGVGGTLCLATS